MMNCMIDMLDHCLSDELVFCGWLFICLGAQFIILVHYRKGCIILMNIIFLLQLQ